MPVNVILSYARKRYIELSYARKRYIELFPSEVSYGLKGER